MTFFSRRNASLALSLAAVGVLAACGDDVTVPIAPPTPVSISITPQAVTLNPGQTGTLSVQITGGAPTPTLQACQSASAAVATAAVAGNTCTVTAVASGNTTVTATTTTGQSASAAVTVNQLPAALGELTVSPSTSNLVGGQTLQLVPNPNRAGTAVTVAYQYTSSAPSVASVNAAGLVTAGSVGSAVITVQATGTGAGFSSATRTTTATINVMSAPQGISSLSASPASLALATSGTGSVAASVQQPNGAPAAVITFGTTNPAVATVAVDANNANLATVTAVAQGTATITVTATSPAGSGFSASTLTQLVSVTVAPAAQVSIGNITTGQTNNPVDITNVQGQIQVPVNITTNGQNVQSVQLWVCLVGETVPACAARSGTPAAEQSFGAAGANSGTVNLFINTAEFTTDAALTNAAVRHTNGQKTIVATLSVAGQATVANNNLAILNFNNMDGFAASHTPPLRSAINASTNTTFFGGPAAEGRGSVTVVPVIYTEGRTIQRVTVGLTGVCVGGSLTLVRGTDARPWNYTYGYSVSTSTSAATRLAADNAARNIACSAQSDGSVDPDIAPRVVSSIDNSQNAGPAVAMASDFRISTSNSPAVLTPASIRVDYVAPSVTTPDVRNALPAVTGWVNGSFRFASNTGASSDAGVGIAPGSRMFQVTGCGSTSFTAMTDGTAASINECAADATGGYDASATADTYGAQTRGPYRVRIVEQDRLQNSGTSANSARFGVDKTAPFIRWSTASVEDTTVLSATSGGVIFQAEFIDERGGFIDNNDVGAVFKSGSSTGVISTTAGSQQHFASRALGDSITISPTTKAFCVNPNSGTPLANTASGAASSSATVAGAAGSAFQTNPSCLFRTVPFAGNLGFAPEGDGYRAGLGATLASREGIYHYATRVYDRAGNVSEVLRRRLAVDATVGMIANLSVPAQVSASANPVLTYNAQDNVEIRATNIRNSFATMGGGASVLTGGLPLNYPQVLVDARFNDNINSPIAQAQTSLNTPTPVLIGLTGNVNATTPVFERLNTVQLTGYDVANRATDSLSGGFLSQGLPNLGGALTGAGNYTSWAVSETRAAGFNAPEGLKAQLIANTNVSNSPFGRVEFYRQTGGAWQYLGSTATAIPADQGAIRYWTYVLADANYAGLPNEFETTQDPAADGDVIVAIGIRNGGAGFITAGTTIGGPVVTPTRIQVTFSGAGTGAAGNATITDGAGFNLAVSTSGTYIVPAAGTYFVTASSVTVNNILYQPSSANPITISNLATGGLGTASFTYAIAATRVSVAVSGLSAGLAPTHSLTGAGFNLTPALGNTVTPVVVNVPAAGTYTLTAASPVASGPFDFVADVNLTGTNTANVVVVTGPTPQAFNVVYSQTNQRLALRIVDTAGVVTPNVTLSCIGGTAAFPLSFGVTGDQLVTVGTTVTPATACTVTAPPVVVGDSTYVATIVNGSPTASTALFTTFDDVLAPAGATTTVTYNLALPTITLTTGAIGNLPPGISFNVVVSGPGFTGGQQTFQVITGQSNVITLPANGTYNLSLPQTISTVSPQQVWTIVANTDVVTGGTATNTGTAAPPANGVVVVSPIIVGAGALTQTTLVNFTGPTTP